MNVAYLITIAYDGTDYAGWQVQPNGVTIQEVLEQAHATLFQCRVKIHGQGRTDAGVHARDQKAHFHVPKSMDTLGYLRAINALLPPQIRVLARVCVPLTFHARFDTKQKTYRYYIATTDPHPLQAPYHWFLPGLDVERMARCACFFQGTHDFSAFSNQQHQGSAKHAPVKTVSACCVHRTHQGCYVEITANGFLYKMVRNIVGCLVAIAKKKKDPQDIATLFAQKNRTQAPMAAPPQGLFLHHVMYRDL